MFLPANHRLEILKQLGGSVRRKMAYGMRGKTAGQSQFRCSARVGLETDFLERSVIAGPSCGDGRPSRRSSASPPLSPQARLEDQASFGAARSCELLPRQKRSTTNII